MHIIENKTHLDALSFIESKESNARTYARTFNRIMTKGLLAKIWDIDGNEYIDCLACAGALPLGHNHPYVMDKVAEFLKSGHLLQALDIPTLAKHDFIRELMQSLPANFAENAHIQFCGPTGSDAVEAALKLFKTATNRRSVFAFHGAYHGMTMGALSMMGNIAPKDKIPGLMSETHFFPFPHSSRCQFGIGGDMGEEASLNYMDNVLSDPESGITKPAMIIVEAVQGEGGCIPAPLQWLKKLRMITEKHDIPLVIDEVQTGFGRTGNMFAFEEAGIVPDAIILSKALGGSFPLAIVAYHKKYDKWSPGAHTGTFRGNQIAMVAGAATMKYIRDNKLYLEAKTKGALLQERLRGLREEFSCIGEIRGRGLMVGMEIISLERENNGRVQLDGKLAQKIKKECFARGVILETGGRNGAILRFLPPLVITEQEIELVVKRLKAAIEAALLS